MPLGKKKRRKKKPPPIATQLVTEDRGTEALTVAWMLSTMVALGAMVFSGIARLTITQLSSQPGEIGAMEAVPHLLLAVATLTGVVSLRRFGSVKNWCSINRVLIDYQDCVHFHISALG